MGTQLCLHKGAKVVSREELLAVPAPAATATWFPLKHGDVLTTGERTLTEAGFTNAKAQLSLARNNNRFFGVLDLSSAVVEGVSLAVGVHNSIDKTFPIGFRAGSRVFVCDNFAFRSELVVVYKHTRNGELRYREANAPAVKGLPQFIEGEAETIDTMQHVLLNPELADSLILRSYETRIISHWVLPAVIKAWRFRPPEFEAETMRSLLNAFTSALRPRATSNPQEFSLQTIRLNALLCQN